MMLMKAVVCPGHGPPDVLKLADVDRPVVPDDGVLVRVRAASLNPVDFFSLSRAARVMRMLAGRTLRPGPEVVGRDFAGTVEAVGRSVARLRPGDAVLGAKTGAFAEYVCAPERVVVPKPDGLTFEQAAAVPVAALTALQALRDHGRLRPGQRVLINGASGGVGTFAVQIARALGAEVTAVCSPRNVELVGSLGADTVIDYTREDFTRSGRRYDLMLDIAGNHSWSECRRVLCPEATFIMVGGSSHTVYGGGETLRHLAALRLASLRASQRVVFFIAKVIKEDLVFLLELCESGRITPVIDRRFDLRDAAAAFHYMGQGHARGKIVIDVEEVRR